MSPGAWPRPRVVVSACLGFAAVRYSGELIPDKVVAALKEHVDFVPVCPEVEIGLGVPRPVVRLVRGEEGPRMVQPKTGEDLTERMRAFSQRFLQGLGEVEGFLLKNRSPSCALKDAKRYAHAEGGGVVGKGPGLFAQAVEEAVAHGVGVLAIADHEGFSGSLEAEPYARAAGVNGVRSMIERKVISI